LIGFTSKYCSKGSAVFRTAFHCHYDAKEQRPFFVGALFFMQY